MFKLIIASVLSGVLAIGGTHSIDEHNVKRSETIVTCAQDSIPVNLESRSVEQPILAAPDAN